MVAKNRLHKLFNAYINNVRIVLAHFKGTGNFVPLLTSVGRTLINLSLHCHRNVILVCHGNDNCSCIRQFPY